MREESTLRSRRDQARFFRAWRVAAPVAAAIVLSFTVDVGAAASGESDTVCRVVRGTLVPVCNASICNQGNVSGDITGRFVSRVTSIYPAGSGWIYTGWTRIELDAGKGRIETTNEGVTPFDSKGGPDLANATEVLVLADATGAYQDYSGTLVIAGAHPVGRAASYVGRLCHHGTLP